MRKTIFLAGLGLLAFGSAAHALPVSAQTRAATFQTVAQGCGWGFHRGPWGGCRPNGAVVVAPAPVVVAPAPRVVVPGPVVVAPRRCWWRNGPYGAVRVCN